MGNQRNPVKAMRVLCALALLLVGLSILSSAVPNIGWASDVLAAQSAPKGTTAPLTLPAASKSLSDIVKIDRTTVAITSSILAVLILLAGGVLLYVTSKGSDPLILRLTPSFFFWLGMIYTGLLLLMALTYDLGVPSAARPVLLGGILPVAVPWFGAVGAVTISLEGVFLWNQQWDRKFNYWHIGRPLFGAVLGIVAFFLFVVIVSAAGSAPKFLDDRTAPGKDYIIFYVVAFLVGYREETFRELIKRVTDLILKPGTPAANAPGVTFKVQGTPQTQIKCPPAAAGATTRATVAVENSGSTALVTPVLTIAPVSATPADAFAIATDRVTGGGDLPPGQARDVELSFAPKTAGQFAATLSLTAKNLDSPKTIRVTGECQ